MRFRYPEWLHRRFNLPYVLDYRIEGSGPPIVMLHGIAASSENWRRLIPLLTEHYTCITIDLLGFGKSPKPAWSDYSAKQHRASIERTINRLRLNNFILIGHSLGGLLAANYAANNPKRINRLVLVSTPIYKGVSESHRGRMKWSQSMYDRVYKYLRTHKRFTLTGARYAKRTILRDDAFVLTEATWQPFIKSLEQCIENQDSMRDIKRISVPIELFYGSRDQLISSRNNELLAKRRSITPHVVKAGHGISDAYAKSIATTLNTR